MPLYTENTQVEIYLDAAFIDQDDDRENYLHKYLKNNLIFGKIEYPCAFIEINTSPFSAYIIGLKYKKGYEDVFLKIDITEELSIFKNEILEIKKENDAIIREPSLKFTIYFDYEGVWINEAVRLQISKFICEKKFNNEEEKDFINYFKKQINESIEYYESKYHKSSNWNYDP